MNRAISGVTQSALESRGYVANDPRTYSTLRSMSTTASSIAGTAAATGTALTLGAITAPAWGTIVLIAAVSAAVGVAVQLGINGLINWLFRSDKRIDIGASTLPYPNCAIGDSNYYWNTTVNGISIYGCDGQSLALQSLHIKSLNIVGSTGPTTCVDSITYWLCTHALAGGGAARYPGIPNQICQSGKYLSGTQCLPYTYPPVPAAPAATNQTLQQSVNALPQTELSKPLNPQLVASTANSLWQQAAAQPGYAGIPYPASNPISTAEATTWMTANPTAWPTVGEFLTPRPVSTTTPEPWALPSNPTQTTTNPSLTTAPNPNVINPSTQPLTNLGEDPATPAPQLETPPTAQQIVDPVLSMIPGHRNFAATTHQGQCPTPTIELYGTHTMNAHCTLIEQNKTVIQAAMAFAWAGIALFIVLSA
jgi:hypothetical protein